jgi:hypothetical protein
VVDLLPDKRVETAAAWMRHHPDMETREPGPWWRICRRCDTWGSSSAAVRRPFPCGEEREREALQPLIARCQAEILTISPPQDAEAVDTPPTLSLAQWRPNIPAHVQRVQQARRAERSARYEQAVELHRLGKSPQEIGKLLGVTGRTIRRWFTTGTFPDAKRRRKRTGSFKDYAPYVLSRWEASERNGLAIYREIKQQGYTGSERTVYRYLEPLKQAEVKASVDVHRITKFTANTAVWLFIRDRQTLDEIEKQDLERFCLASPQLSLAYQLAHDFLVIVRKREGHRLDEWLQHVARSGLPELQSFASGVEKDKEAVRVGLPLAINNGMVEGHVTKLKLIKRQGSGRAGFPLLRQRVLHAL